VGEGGGCGCYGQVHYYCVLTCLAYIRNIREELSVRGNTIAPGDPRDGHGVSGGGGRGSVSAS
jgi:hypothetical protein